MCGANTQTLTIPFWQFKTQCIHPRRSHSSMLSYGYKLIAGSSVKAERGTRVGHGDLKIKKNPAYPLQKRMCWQLWGWKLYFNFLIEKWQKWILVRHISCAVHLRFKHVGSVWRLFVDRQTGHWEDSRHGPSPGAEARRRHTGGWLTDGAHRESAAHLTSVFHFPALHVFSRRFYMPVLVTLRKYRCFCLFLHEKLKKTLWDLSALSHRTLFFNLNSEFLFWKDRTLV